MLPFQDAAPTPAGDWRHIVRFGRNVASYKFALGQALLELAARQQTFVPLPELAVPYAAALCEHLQVEDRQRNEPWCSPTVRLIVMLWGLRSGPARHGPADPAQRDYQHDRRGDQRRNDVGRIVTGLTLR